MFIYMHYKYKRLQSLTINVNSTFNSVDVEDIYMKRLDKY